MKLSRTTARALTAGALVAAVGSTGLSGVASAATSAPIRTTSVFATVSAESSVVEVNMSNLEAVKKMADTRPVVFLVTAPSWCGACKQLDPVIRAMNAKDGGSWVLAIMDRDKDGGAGKKMFTGITGLPTAIAYGRGAEMTNPKRMIGWGGESTTRTWIDSVVKAYGPVTPAPTGTPAPTSTPAPTQTTPGPLPTKPGPTGTTPAPEPTKPGPTGTTPAPEPTKPGPTGTTPAPEPTKPGPTGTTPAPEPTTTTPAPDGAVVTVASEEEWKAVIELSKQRPVVVRVHLDGQLPMLSGQNGKMAAAAVAKDAGRWTLANVDLEKLGMAGLAKLGIPMKGMPSMTVLKDGKFVGESLAGHSTETEMRTWIDANVGR
ncbi:thioredoxin family protein [Arsenicicoccus dermatophilus]|uniref:thioredoxin family protein n=1 Tax=Arsenicicoccus dermatophilus TaxID=1076331 RepID=UPI001F4CBC41|nr:thioredoxin domain-containing protein [Arsenicicoccus dermatophilus]MCH8613208.1 thioredoxin domain-containing protein [Arsenicicoccus dermatophilus]